MAEKLLPCYDALYKFRDRSQFRQLPQLSGHLTDSKFVSAYYVCDLSNYLGWHF